eukprot:14021984-Alexandrium_andersonii.AAC.1
MDGPHRARGPPQGGVAHPAGAAGPGHTHHRGDDGRGVRCRGWQCAQGRAPVSYTHLTLPTICSV